MCTYKYSFVLKPKTAVPNAVSLRLRFLSVSRAGALLDAGSEGGFGRRLILIDGRLYGTISRRAWLTQRCALFSNLAFVSPRLSALTHHRRRRGQHNAWYTGRSAVTASAGPRVPSPAMSSHRRLLATASLSNSKSHRSFCGTHPSFADFLDFLPS